MNVAARAILNPTRRNVLFRLQAVRKCGGCCNPCCCWRGSPIIRMGEIKVPPSKKEIVLDIVNRLNAAEGDALDLDKIVEDTSAKEISVSWNDDEPELSGNSNIYRLLGKFKNKLLYPEDAVEAAEVDQVLELAESLANGGNPKDPRFSKLLQEKEPFVCEEADGPRTLTSKKITVAHIVLKHELASLQS